MSALRVLVIGPTYSLDPMCGDVTVTEALLRSTTDEVEFTGYDLALDDKSLRNIVHNASSLSEAIQSVLVKVINRLRLPLRLFREDFRLYEVDSSQYDLVHVFVFPVNLRFTGKKLPVVFSQAISNKKLYLDARKWSIRHFTYAIIIEKLLSAHFRVLNPNFSRIKVDLYLAYTRFHADEVRGAVSQSNNVCIWHPFIPLRENVRITESDGRKVRIGFVAKDFVAKGGPLVLQVVSLLRSSGFDVELHIAGSKVPRDERWIVSYGSLSHDDLFERFYASVDIMLYPTKFDGWPLVVAEAQSVGVPVFVSSYCGVPDLVPSQDFVVDSYDAETWMTVVSKFLSCDLLETKHAVRMFARNKYGETEVIRELVAHYKGLIACE